MDPEIAPIPGHHHRDVNRGAARAAVFGVSDGLVSIAALIIGVAASDAGASFVRLAGLAGLIGGAVSMAFGEYNSMRVQSELLQRELDLEREALTTQPHVEVVELAQIYQSRGMDADRARDMAQSMMRNPDLALEVHAREELGINPGELGSPLAAAGSSFVAFALGALVPLLPWFVGGGTAALVSSVVLALVAAAVVGLATSRFTGRQPLLTAARQVALTALPAALTFGIGSAVGVNV